MKAMNCLWMISLDMAAAVAQVPETVVHVLAGASEGGDGSRGAPVRTLDEARTMIRAARADGSLPAGQPVTVLVGPGDYPRSETFVLSSDDSGTEGAPLVIRAARPGSARIHGAVMVPSGAFGPVTDDAVLARLDPAVRGRVLVCDLSSFTPGPFPDLKPGFRGRPSAPWLYIDGEPMTLARWPNADAPGGGWLTFKKAVDNGLPRPDATDPALRKPRPGSFLFQHDRPARWRFDEGVWLLGYWTHDWYEEAIRAASHDAATGVMTLAAPHSYGLAMSTWGGNERRFFAFNLLEELDAPGEWFLDRQANRLYLVPSAAHGPESRIALSVLTAPLLRIERAAHIRVEGLVFEYAHADGIVLDDASHIEIAGCAVINCAGRGIGVSGRDNTVRSCDLFHLGLNGISLAGGDRAQLIPANNRALNNHIHRFGRFQRTYAPGISASGVGQIARNNRIHDAPHSAIIYGGNEHVFEYNDIYRVVMETADAGALYTGRDWGGRGNIVRHNLIRDLGPADGNPIHRMGVYLDDCASGDTIEGNVLIRAGRALMIGGGRDNVVVNNVTVDCAYGLHLDARGLKRIDWDGPASSSWNLKAKIEAVKYSAPPWSERYPRLAAILNEEPALPLGNVIRRNVFIDCVKQVANIDGESRKMMHRLDIADNLAVDSSGTNTAAIVDGLPGFANLTSADPGFVDARAGDVALRPDARLLRALPDFQPIPSIRVGLHADEYRPSLPPR